jgi:hypothetical protein
MITKRITMVLAVCLLTAVVLAAQASKLEGTWEGKVDHEGVMETMTFEFHAKGTAITGKVLRNGQEFGDISGARLTGNKISFSADVVTFEGTLEGEQLKMTITVYNGTKYSMNASRKKAGS